MDFKQWTRDYHENYLIVDALKVNDPHINDQDDQGDTLLMIASRNTYPDLVKSLIEKGADVNLENRVKSTPLLVAASNNNLDIVEMLISSGAEVNHQNISGITPLVAAARLKYLNIVEELLSSGADLYMRTIDDEIPLFHVLVNGGLKIIKAHDPNFDLSTIDTKNFKGNPPLNYAIEIGNTETAIELIRQGINIHLKGEYEDTAIIKAADVNNSSVILELIRHGAKINDKDEVGNTPLMHAAKKGNLPIVKLLVENGAGVNMINKFRMDPLFFAAQSGKLEIVDYLLQHGSKPLLETPVDFERAYHTPLYPIPRYSLTGRPVADMGYLNSKMVCSGKYYLPVIRYQSLYYGKRATEEKFCGTFYFFEPSSNYFLSLGKFLVANNKIDAYRQLVKTLVESPNKLSAIDPITIKVSLPDVALNEEKDVSKFYPFKDRFIATSNIVKPSRYVPQETITPLYYDEDKKYVGKQYLGQYDSLDQPICSLAHKAGYDTVILQREPGETRTVTEILDTRPREISFQSFCQNEDLTFHELASKSKYPTIWFRSYGVLNM